MLRFDLVQLQKDRIVGFYWVLCQYLPLAKLDGCYGTHARGRLLQGNGRVHGRGPARGHQGPGLPEKCHYSSEGLEAARRAVMRPRACAQLQAIASKQVGAAQALSLIHI